MIHMSKIIFSFLQQLIDSTRLRNLVLYIHLENDVYQLQLDIVRDFVSFEIRREIIHYCHDVISLDTMRDKQIIEQLPPQKEKVSVNTSFSCLEVRMLFS